MKQTPAGWELLSSIGRSGYILSPPANNVINASDRHVSYGGVYRVIQKNGDVKYIKSSLELSGSERRFSFEDEETAKNHIDVYRKFAEIGFYHPESFFDIIQSGNEIGVMCAMPELATRNGIKKRIKEFPTEEFNKTWSGFFNEWPLGYFHGDVTVSTNYGISDEGNIHYFDLNLFECIPSPLVSDPRIKSTSA